MNTIYIKLYPLIDFDQQLHTRTRFRARRVYCRSERKTGQSGGPTAAITPISPRNCGYGVYGAVTLFAGDVVFDEVGMLQPGELDREAVFDITDNAARCLPIATAAPTGGRRSGAIATAAPDADRSMTTAGDIDAVRRDQPRRRIAGRETAAATVFRQIEDPPISEPSELGGEPVAFCAMSPKWSRQIRCQ